jgi:hypothetical protein
MDHRRQWDGLVREYLSLTLMQRWVWQTLFILRLDFQTD